MNTVTGRTLYRLLVDNLFVTAATFKSGANKTIIAYPWGSLNHRTQSSDGAYISVETPDYKAFRALGLALQDSAGENITFQQQQTVLKKYTVGDVITAGFPQNGTLTDWAYGAGWDKQPYSAIPECFSQSEPPLAADFFNRTTTENVRTAIYMIETYPDRDPAQSLYGGR